MMKEKMTRREALLSLATIAAGTAIKTNSVFAAQSAKFRLRFPLVGDCGTGDRDQIGIAKQMFDAYW